MYVAMNQRIFARLKPHARTEEPALCTQTNTGVIVGRSTKEPIALAVSKYNNNNYNSSTSVISAI